MSETDDHLLVVEPQGDETFGRCSCGHWQRCVGHDMVVLTGRSREEALRHAHEMHARTIEA